MEVRMINHLQAKSKIYPKLVFCMTLLLLFIEAFSAFASEQPPFYRKKDTWFETMMASRDFLRGYRDGFLGSAGITLGPWYVIGPFTGKKPFFEKFAPEKKVNLKKTYAGQLNWIEKTDWEDGRVQPLPPAENSATYVYRTISAEQAFSHLLYLGSDDGIKVWLNGKLILQDDIYRGCAPNQETANLRLKAGENRLLMKITNGGGPTAFYFSLFEYGPEDIWQILEEDFKDARSLQEMSWERQDKIWDKEWTPGDYDELGQRYVQAYFRSCDERGVQPDKPPATFKDKNALMKMRGVYLDSRQKEFVILTPKPSPSPRINGARVFGVRPSVPFLYTLPATGERPMEFSAENLPNGLVLDSNTGRITGTIQAEGEYPVILKAKNAFGSAEQKFLIVAGEKVALTPPLGWNSWNCFAGAVDDKKIRAAAGAMAESGLINHGWTYINIDDCWMVKPDSDDPLLKGQPRDEKGMINSNKKFPDMKALSEYVHSQGLKLGIYTSPGPLTCAGFTASYQHEEKDAQRFADWGIDYLKYDWCSYDGIAKDRSLEELKKPYAIMRAALKKINRDIIYSLCQYGMGDVWKWGAEVGGNSWRTTGDITDTWESMSGIGFSQAGHEVYAGPGHWNDPDMLVVGYVGWGPKLHPTRLSANEQYTHITLWSLLAAPLLIGCDLTRLDDFTLGLLTNDEVLAVNQDPLGKQASRISKNGELEVWGRELEDGSKAVGLFNRGEKPSTVIVHWDELGISGNKAVRDLWRQKDLGIFEGSFSLTIPRHGAALVKISAASGSEHK